MKIGLCDDYENPTKRIYTQKNFNTERKNLISDGNKISGIEGI